MSKHKKKRNPRRTGEVADTEKPRQPTQSGWRWYVGSVLVIFGIAPGFLLPSYSAHSCPDVTRNAYREIALDVLPTGMHGKLEYCAFPYHIGGGRGSSTRIYDTTPWSDFCGPTKAEVEARVEEFRKPEVDAQKQCQRSFGEAARSFLNHPFRTLFGS
ncbi:hypothetical protein AB4Y45_33785 [Paraburkholderia sp. EG287A]|uniref:hypothetical protein n=1 Tax=Paraburkholderia sp. EG287A TaxID=3237012 RepID=UPI0034D1E9DC